jgi:hypothetical protein
MEKKMRYQIDKLLALFTVIHSGGGSKMMTGEAGMFAAVGREKELAEETEMKGDYAKDSTSSSNYRGC